MTATIYETQETRDFSMSGGRVSASRRFVVFDDAAEITEPAVVRDLFGAGLPEMGDLFPGEWNIFATNYAITRRAGSSGVWDVEISYSNNEPGTFQPAEVGYVDYSIDYSAEFRELWRVGSGLIIPANGSPNTNDIAGVKIDQAGVPVSVLVRMSTIQITETVTSVSIPARSLVIRAARGRRNNTVFQGAPVGQALYQGATATRIAIDTYTITHKFSQDEYSHLLQVPARDQNGEVIKAVTASVFNASIVRFVQPFPNSYDFNAISENF
jgi:hypothetical protein